LTNSSGIKYSLCMNAATLITCTRIFLSPVFFLVFTLYSGPGKGSLPTVVILWILFIVIELTDWLDGKVARKSNTVTDLGKLLDPFADSFSRLTYFLSFVVAGMMPGWIFLIVMYRDLGVSFVRLINMKNKIVMGARLSGKIKAWVYAVAGGGGLAYFTATKLDFLSFAASPLWVFVTVLFYASALVAVWTMIDYASSLRNGGTR
jgi:CDP-diacylglycerol---glycerol-3-phosphate 3-phosphatidyltransferase